MASKDLEADADAAAVAPCCPGLAAALQSGDELVPDSVGIRELARNVSGIVAAVASTGRPTVVTKHGRPVAVVVSLLATRLTDKVGTGSEELRLNLPASVRVGDGPR